MTFKSCSGQSGYTADCTNVNSIEEDLTGLPPGLNNICIFVTTRSNGSLHMGVFSQFQDLKYLEIRGCFTQILPTGGVQGLPSLQYLILEGYQYGEARECCHGNFDAHSFSDLVNLTTIYINQYKLSVMAPDIFNLMFHLQTLSIHECCVHELSEIVCRIMNIQSLQELFITAYEVEEIQPVNCSVLIGNSSIPPVLPPNLKTLSLQVGHIKVLEEGALTWLQNFSSFEGKYSQDTLVRIPLSGLKQINTIEVIAFNNSEEIDFKLICDVIFKMSVKKIFLWLGYNYRFASTSVSSCIGLEGMLVQSWGTEHPIPLTFKLNVITGLINLKWLRLQGKRLDMGDLCSFHTKTILRLTNLVLVIFLEKLVAKQFSCLRRLQYLDLSYNTISYIEDSAFFGLKKLEFLYMKNNKLTDIKMNTFLGLEKLTLLDVTENPLVHIEAGSFSHLGSLSQVFLGDLRLPPSQTMIMLNLSEIFRSSLSQLTQLYISSGMRPMQLAIGASVSSNQNLSLQLKGHTVTFEDCNGPFFESVVHLKADTEQILCGSEFIGRFFQSLETFEFKSKLSAKSIDLTPLNQMVHLRKLILIEVDLSNQTSADAIFHNLTKLEELQLLACRLNILEGSLTKDLRSLRTFVVHIRNIYNVIYSLTEPLVSLKYITFEEFETFCSCDNAWLVPWAKNQKQVEVMINPLEGEELDVNSLKCLSDNGMDRLNFLKYSEANCSADPGFVLFLATCLGVLLFMLAVLLHNLAGHYLLPFYHITLGWLSEAMRSNSRRRYHYDAFVSYSGKDERWVVEELLPNLEQRGPPFLRLCLHSRDFQLGKDIVENITESLYRSRHTLCLVSRHYLHSNWCSLEMRLATCRLQAEHRDVLILVFLEKISPRRLSVHHRLARLVKTRTYLDWPQEPGQQEAFWVKLWTKLKPPTQD
ncbi:toll-like receptor 13 [Hypomesus transpacificus]|uniref:toll-like receptor 13 n=1 Tax=Hypomesus transpacificus TaxID=137520 RepID=UPI001F07F830|nr:toll-like receptor 13 [Hypomesus transpacificus]